MARGRRRCFGCASHLEASYVYCPYCGVRLDSGVAEPNPTTAGEPPNIYARERPRLFGVPPQDTMLTLGALGLAVAFAAFATGRVAAGIAVLVISYVVLGAFAAAVRRRPASVLTRKALEWGRLLRGDIETVYAAIVSHAARRLRRAQLRHERRSLVKERRGRLLELGEAVHEDDDDAAGVVHEILADLDERIADNLAETEGVERRAARQIRALTLATAGD